MKLLTQIVSSYIVAIYTKELVLVHKGIILENTQVLEVMMVIMFNLIVRDILLFFVDRQEEQCFEGSEAIDKGNNKHNFSNKLSNLFKV